jgi:hypothetical protein
MGVAQFTAALQSKAYQSWYDNAVSNILRDNTKKIRQEASSANVNDFVISDKDIQLIIDSFASPEADREKLLKDIRKNLKNTTFKNRMTVSKENGIHFTGVSFREGIASILEQGLRGTGIDSTRVSEKLEKGHVVGLATKLFERTSKELQTARMPLKFKMALQTAFNEYIAALKQLDLDSSNDFSADSKLFAKYSKSSTRFLVELQSKADNQGSQKKVNALLKPLYTAMSMDKFTAEGLANTLKDRDSTLNAKISRGIINRLVESQGSPSFLELIRNDFLDILANGYKGQKKEHNIPYVYLDTLKFRIKPNKDLKKVIAGNIAAARRALTALDKQQEDRNAPLPMSSLLPILNKLLPPQVKSNMGTGDRRDVLNYRTGRFANSTKIVNITRSRQGMTTAFYTYMKNPYSTFSSGGAQEFPRSRDPKLLISKSVREVLAEFVEGNMRAVLV